MTSSDQMIHPLEDKQSHCDSRFEDLLRHVIAELTTVIIELVQ